jgi:hypothetical protein
VSRRPRLGDVVEVLWIDSATVELGWEARSTYLAAITVPASYRTAGYWLGRRRGIVAVALSLDPAHGLVTDAMSIPDVAVTRIRILGRARRRTRRALRR